jgi:regulator of sigma E protease
VNPLSDRVTNSFFIPSLPEALNSWYVHYDGIEISAISWSIAASTGIGDGEKVISIDGVTIASPQEFIALVSQNKPINLVLHNREVQRTVSITPVDGKIWVHVGYHNLTIDKQYSRQYRLPEAILHGARETYYSSVLTLDFLSTMLHGIFVPDNATEREEAKSMLSWPIGVGATFVWLVEISAPVSLVLIVIALISVNLWVVNLLPIPALDGGRIVTTTLYSLIVRYFQRGVEVFLQFEKYFHTIGFILLLLLTLYVAGLDISRFF